MFAARPRTLLVCLLAALPVAGLWAQGTVVIDRPVPLPNGRVTTMPLTLKYQRIYAEITDGVAVTTVKQSFMNPLRTPIEGTYVFPLPDEVAVGDFAMTVAGKTLHGEVLEKQQARQTYEAIVRRTQDPGLLEFLGKRLYQASVFPIPPGEKLDIELRYVQTLTERDGFGQFTHPLRAPGGAAAEIEDLTVQVKVKSTLPLASVYCPSHKCDVDRPNDNEATLTYEAGHVTPDRDFDLYYQRKDAAFGMSVLTHRRAGEPGYFMLRLSPRVEIAERKILSKDIAFIVDTSGSMEGEKIEQTRRALRLCIAGLREQDRFNIYRFSTQVEPFRDKLVSATSEIREAAGQFADKLVAVGGTNINDALLAALRDDPRDADRPYIVVFITDGEPTVNVTEPPEILDNVKQANGASVRFHVLGVGTDVNTYLLDKLAEMNRGTREYVVENENLEVKLGALVKRLNNPVMTDLTLTLGELQAADVYPSTLPDLFQGSDIVVLGRYDTQGHHAVSLRGSVGDEQQTLVFEHNFPATESGNDFLPRLWANRKVAYLLDEIRLHGGNKELVDEVIRLATRYGIVTPYTSALILEDERQLARAGRGRFAGGGLMPATRELSEDELENLRALGYAGGADDDRDQPAARSPRIRELRPGGVRGGMRGGAPRGSGLAPARSGEAAVDLTKSVNEISVADALADARKNVGRFPLHHVGERAFVLIDGRYIDTRWDGQREPTQIEAFSAAYFDLLRDRPEVTACLALGDRVVIALDDIVYEIVPASNDQQEQPKP